MAYEYEGKFISLLDRLDEEEREFVFRGIDDELKEVYAKARAFDEILEAYKDSSEQDRLVGIFEGQVTTILDEYMEDE